jgi:hypothetical protein
MAITVDCDVTVTAGATASRRRSATACCKRGQARPRLCPMRDIEVGRCKMPTRRVGSAGRIHARIGCWRVMVGARGDKPP